MNKTIAVNGVTYALSSTLGETPSTLERLVKKGKLTRLVLGGVSYYNQDQVKAFFAEARKIPDGYVKVMAYAPKIGASRQSIQKACAKRGAPATRVMATKGRSAWYADKAWIDRTFAAVPKQPALKKEIIVAKKVAKPTKKAATADRLEGLIARAEALVTRLEGILGTEHTASNGASNGANGHARDVDFEITVG